MSTFRQLAEFILENHDPHRNWQPDIFEGWLKWHVHHGFVQRALDFDGSIVGATIIRTVMKPEDGNDHYAFDPEGGVAFIDLAIATKPGALQALVLAGLERFGRRPWIAWKRPPFHVTKFHDTERFLRIILGGEIYGRRE